MQVYNIIHFYVIIKLYCLHRIKVHKENTIRLIYPTILSYQIYLYK